MKKILYGVCGIGSGHTHRQLPLIEYFSKFCQIVIFAYGYSLEFYKDYFKNSKNISLIQVAVPFYVGNKNGIDMEATKKLPQNQGIDFDRINSQAREHMSQILNMPDLVITDYEPISAQFSYDHNIPLVTIDQQSKYFCADLSDRIVGNISVYEELARLKMFFPKADTRIACSFFKVPQQQNCEYKVEVVPPVIKSEVLKLDRKHLNLHSILIYISGARDFVQTTEDILRICSEFEEIEFHIFLGSGELFDPRGKFSKPNLHIYSHGDLSFYKVFNSCTGVVSTAGHSLLSEAIYLGVPIYVIPIGPYEQHKNAYIINKYSFGISWPKLSKEKLTYFTQNLDQFSKNIKLDTEILFKGSGQKKIIDLVESRFL